ncbi:MAG: hypothetical protein JXB30_06840, partial [Anaerolineae bacterium]|nr:hypothetical protein [Anaerolineae bacterium]
AQNWLCNAARIVADLGKLAARLTRRALGIEIKMIRTVQKWHRRRKYQEGKRVSRFIARDIRRDVLVVNASRIDEGIITGRVRTINALYLRNELIEQPEYGPVQEIRIDEIWHWTGQSWGGLPDGTSLVAHSDRKMSD